MRFAVCDLVGVGFQLLAGSLLVAGLYHGVSMIGVAAALATERFAVEDA